MIEQTFKWAGHAHRFAKRANAQKTHDEIIVALAPSFKICST